MILIISFSQSLSTKTRIDRNKLSNYWNNYLIYYVTLCADLAGSDLDFNGEQPKGTNTDYITHKTKKFLSEFTEIYSSVT